MAGPTPGDGRPHPRGGHARSLGLVMVTNNVREFTSVPGLEVEDWLSPQV